MPDNPSTSSSIEPDNSSGLVIANLLQPESTGTNPQSIRDSRQLSDGQESPSLDVQPRIASFDPVQLLDQFIAGKSLSEQLWEEAFLHAVWLKPGYVRNRRSSASKNLWSGICGDGPLLEDGIDSDTSHELDSESVAEDAQDASYFQVLHETRYMRAYWTKKSSVRDETKTPWELVFDPSDDPGNLVECYGCSMCCSEQLSDEIGAIWKESQV